MKRPIYFFALLLTGLILPLPVAAQSVSAVFNRGNATFILRNGTDLFYLPSMEGASSVPIGQIIPLDKDTEASLGRLDQQRTEKLVFARLFEFALDTTLRLIEQKPQEANGIIETAYALDLGGDKLCALAIKFKGQDAFTVILPGSLAEPENPAPETLSAKRPFAQNWDSLLSYLKDFLTNRLGAKSETIYPNLISNAPDTWLPVPGDTLFQGQRLMHYHKERKSFDSYESTGIQCFYIRIPVDSVYYNEDNGLNHFLKITQNNFENFIRQWNGNARYPIGYTSPTLRYQGFNLTTGRMQGEALFDSEEFLAYLKSGKEWPQLKVTNAKPQYRRVAYLDQAREDRAFVLAFITLLLRNTASVAIIYHAKAALFVTLETSLHHWNPTERTLKELGSVAKLEASNIWQAFLEYTDARLTAESELKIVDFAQLPPIHGEAPIAVYYVVEGRKEPYATLWITAPDQRIHRAKIKGFEHVKSDTRFLAQLLPQLPAGAEVIEIINHQAKRFVIAGPLLIAWVSDTLRPLGTLPPLHSSSLKASLVAHCAEHFTEITDTIAVEVFREGSGWEMLTVSLQSGDKTTFLLGVKGEPASLKSHYLYTGDTQVPERVLAAMLAGLTVQPSDTAEVTKVKDQYVVSANDLLWFYRDTTGALEKVGSLPQFPSNQLRSYSLEKLVDKVQNAPGVTIKDTYTWRESNEFSGLALLFSDGKHGNWDVYFEQKGVPPSTRHVKHLDEFRSEKAFLKASLTSSFPGSEVALHGKATGRKGVWIQERNDQVAEVLVWFEGATQLQSLGHVVKHKEIDDFLWKKFIEETIDQIQPDHLPRFDINENFLRTTTEYQIFTTRYADRDHTTFWFRDVKKAPAAINIRRGSDSVKLSPELLQMLQFYAAEKNTVVDVYPTLNGMFTQSANKLAYWHKGQATMQELGVLPRIGNSAIVNRLLAELEADLGHKRPITLRDTILHRFIGGTEILATRTVIDSDSTTLIGVIEGGTPRRLKINNFDPIEQRLDLLVLMIKELPLQVTSLAVDTSQLIVFLLTDQGLWGSAQGKLLPFGKVKKPRNPKLWNYFLNQLVHRQNNGGSITIEDFLCNEVAGNEVLSIHFAETDQLVNYTIDASGKHQVVIEGPDLVNRENLILPRLAATAAALPVGIDTLHLEKRVGSNVYLTAGQGIWVYQEKDSAFRMLGKVDLPQVKRVREAFWEYTDGKLLPAADGMIESTFLMKKGTRDAVLCIKYAGDTTYTVFNSYIPSAAPRGCVQFISNIEAIQVDTALALSLAETLQDGVGRRFSLVKQNDLLFIVDDEMILYLFKDTKRIAVCKVPHPDYKVLVTLCSYLAKQKQFMQSDSTLVQDVFYEQVSANIFSNIIGINIKGYEYCLLPIGGNPKNKSIRGIVLNTEFDRFKDNSYLRKRYIQLLFEEPDLIDSLLMNSQQNESSLDASKFIKAGIHNEHLYVISFESHRITYIYGRGRDITTFKISKEISKETNFDGLAELDRGKLPQNIIDNLMRELQAEKTGGIIEFFNKRGFCLSLFRNGKDSSSSRNYSFYSAELTYSPLKLDEKRIADAIIQSTKGSLKEEVRKTINSSPSVRRDCIVGFLKYILEFSIVNAKTQKTYVTVYKRDLCERIVNSLGISGYSISGNIIEDSIFNIFKDK